jgi:hypothetical protein
MAVLPTGIGPVTGGYQIERSLRFNFADSAYLNRTPGSASNRTTWTYSYWFKGMMLKPGVNDYWALSAFSDGNNYTAIRHHNEYYIDVLSFNAGSAVAIVKTQQVFRDPSAWNHIVVTFDTSNATQADRVRIYHNGVRCDIRSGATYPGSGSPTGFVNNTTAHYIGSQTTEYFDGYMAEINLIDGQALTPSSFGETDTNTGVWKPKAYTGTYGTNGFFLKFADNSGTTSTTLGKDSSGNGNNWTPNNFSVTAGSGNDSLVDTPTSYGTDTGVGGEVRGNYATLNPLTKNTADTYTITNGNLDFDLGGPSSSSGDLRGTIGVSSGKWYWEVFCTEVTAAGNLLGITNNPTNGSDGFRALGAYTFQYYDDGTADTNKVQGTGAGTTTTNYGPNTNLLNKTIGFALDLDGGTITVYIDGSSQGTMFSSLPSGTYFPLFCLQTAKIQVNFGQRAFAYTAPSGFKALCTTNLPTPTIGATSTTLAGKYFNPIIYTGTGSVRSLTGVGFQPDLVWIKGRSQATGHGLFNSVIGATKGLSSNSNAAQFTDANSLTAFNSDGFSLGTDATNNFVNVNTQTYVAWNWNAGGSNATNTAGTITSTVRANTTSGFSVVSFNAGSAGNKTVGHGLGASLNLWIMKSLSTANNSWSVGSSALATPASNYLVLNGTAASTSDTRLWANAAPTSTVFSFESNYTVPANADCIAYCFAAVAGYSAFGSYTGNGSTDGPFVYLGFRPRYVLIKNATDTGGNAWLVFDTARDTYNVTKGYLAPNNSNAENTASSILDMTSNGFKLRDSFVAWNGSANTIIYAAFAESPFKYALAR